MGKSHQSHHIHTTTRNRISIVSQYHSPDSFYKDAHTHTTSSETIIAPNRHNHCRHNRFYRVTSSHTLFTPNTIARLLSFFHALVTQSPSDSSNSIETNHSSIASLPSPLPTRLPRIPSPNNHIVLPTPSAQSSAQAPSLSSYCSKTTKTRKSLPAAA